MRIGTAHGYTLIEILLALSIVTVLLGVALPMTEEALDTLRTQGAARYLAGRIIQGRMDAIKRSTIVGLRFVAFSSSDYTYGVYLDGNQNGIRAADITSGTDRLMGSVERVGDHFAGVSVGLMPGLPDADGVQNTGTDGVRFGAADILTTSPNGTATPGTLYVRGKHAQYAVRVLGATGRVRVMEYRRGDGTWMNR